MNIVLIKTFLIATLIISINATKFISSSSGYFSTCSTDDVYDIYHSQTYSIYRTNSHIYADNPTDSLFRYKTISPSTRIQPYIEGELYNGYFGYMIDGSVNTEMSFGVIRYDGTTHWAHYTSPTFTTVDTYENFQLRFIQDLSSNYYALVSNGDDTAATKTFELYLIPVTETEATAATITSLTVTSQDSKLFYLRKTADSSDFFHFHHININDKTQEEFKFKITAGAITDLTSLGQNSLEALPAIGETTPIKEIEDLALFVSNKEDTTYPGSLLIYSNDLSTIKAYTTGTIYSPKFSFIKLEDLYYLIILPFENLNRAHLYHLFIKDNTVTFEKLDVLLLYPFSKNLFYLKKENTDAKLIIGRSDNNFMFYFNLCGISSAYDSSAKTCSACSSGTYNYGMKSTCDTTSCSREYHDIGKCINDVCAQKESVEHTVYIDSNSCDYNCEGGYVPASGEPTTNPGACE